MLKDYQKLQDNATSSNKIFLKFGPSLFLNTPTLWVQPLFVINANLMT